MTTSKSPNTIALVAYGTAKRALPPYRHKKSPKKFTQPQLVACLVLKKFFRIDYRGITEILQDSSELRSILELEEVPHYTTLQKAASRLGKKPTLLRLVSTSLAIAVNAKVMKRNIAIAGLDSTGFESHYTSMYFVHRRGRRTDDPYETTQYTRFPKTAIIADCDSYLVLAGLPSWGPSPDIWHWTAALEELSRQTRPRILVADAGYDAEWAHRLAREKYDIRTIIPNRIGRPTTKLPTGKYRKLMAIRFNHALYGLRWHIETINSILKRRLSSFLRARTYWSQMREIMLRLFTYNVMVL